MPENSPNHLKGRLTRALIDFFEEDDRRITHALDVLHESEKIFEQDPASYDRDIVIAAALLHDVGIKPSETELGYNNGPSQEKYGPPVARDLLGALNFPAEKIDIVCNIIGNHHSRSRFPYPELELLKKADRIVNMREASKPE